MCVCMCELVYRIEMNKDVLIAVLLVKGLFLHYMPQYPCVKKCMIYISTLLYNSHSEGGSGDGGGYIFLSNKKCAI